MLVAYELVDMKNGEIVAECLTSSSTKTHLS